mgnify:CR=1 FL=1
MNFPLTTTFATSQHFWYAVLSLFVSMYLLISLFISSLTQLFFSSMLFNLHVFVVLPAFFLQLISSFKALLSENMVAYMC